MKPGLTTPNDWIRGAVAAAWAGSYPESVVALKGDASTRRFWRIAITGSNNAAPSTAIAIALGPDDLPLYAKTLHLVPEPLAEPPWITMRRFFAETGVAVPQLYQADLNHRMLLVEDVGELPLSDAAARADAADLFRLAADELLRIHLDGTRELMPNVIASRIAYDARLFRWELEQFLELAPEIIGPGADRAMLNRELDNLADKLDRLPRVLSHRDYHGHNLFLQSDETGKQRVRVIDFQDALMAPPAQDLAVLLTTRDTSKLIGERVEQRVIEYYYAATIRRGAGQMPLQTFIESYRLCVLQHALKVIGRFSYLEKNGKSGYSQFIPFALDQGRRMLAQLNYYPALRSALRE